MILSFKEFTFCAGNKSGKKEKERPECTPQFYIMTFVQTERANAILDDSHLIKSAGSCLISPSGPVWHTVLCYQLFDVDIPLYKCLSIKFLQIS